MLRSKEKPSTLSHNILKTQIRNELENIILEQKVRQINRDRINRSYNIIQNLQELRLKMKELKQTKKKMSVSPARRMFLSQYGFSTPCKEFDINYFMSLIFDDIEEPTEKDQPLIRVTDFLRAREKTEREKILHKHELEARAIEERKVKREIELKRTNNNASAKKNVQTNTIKITRKIEPPYKGREMWRVHLDKKHEEHEPVLTKEQHESMDLAVEAYRMKFVNKYQQINPIKGQRQRPASCIGSKSRRSEVPVRQTKSATVRSKPVDSVLGNDITMTIQQESTEINDTPQQLPIPELINNKNRPHSSSKHVNFTEKKRTERRRRSMNYNRMHDQISSREHYSQMQINLKGKTASIFLSKF